jgi:non-specific serine/threonine protein kinase
LTGVGGSGKTRLALAVAEAMLAGYPDGVWLVELAPLPASPAADPTAAAAATLAALRLHEVPGQTLLQTLIEQFESRCLLLVLDNCEHMVGACAALTAQLLPTCPELQILATSQYPLGLAQETVWQVETLDIPPAIEGAPTQELLSLLDQTEAVQLFIDRAQAARPGFALSVENAPGIASICRQLDGLPLAIELAAARLNMLAVDEFLTRLTDRFKVLRRGGHTVADRHQTLQATMDWSYDLLESSDQAVLRRLAVFTGGWDVSAAEAVCAGGLVPAESVLEALDELLARSLVHTYTAGGTPRYGMLETVRHYGLQQLDRTGEAATTRDRHLMWCVSLSEETGLALLGAEQAKVFARLDREHDNLRAALQWALDGGLSDPGLRLAAGLWKYWRSRGYLSEGRRWFTHLLTLAPDGDHDVDPTLRASALEGAAWLAEDQHDFAQASELFAESTELRRALGQDDRKSALLINRALEARASGNYHRATALLEESLAWHRSQENRDSLMHGGLGISLSRLALVLNEQGEYARAKELQEECLAFHRDLGDQEGMAWALLGLGDIARNQGDAKLLRSYCEQSLALFRDLGHSPGIGFSLNNLALAALMEGNMPEAGRSAEETEALFRSLHHLPGLAEALITVGRIRGAQGETRAAGRDLAEALDLAWQEGPRFVVAAALEALAVESVLQGHAQHAVSILGAVAELRQSIGVPVRPADQADLDHALEEGRKILGPGAFAEAWTTGQILSLEHIVEWQHDLDQPQHASLPSTGRIAVPASSTMVSGPAMTPDSSPPAGSPAMPGMRDGAVLELLVLGPPVLRWGEQEVRVRTRKAFILLAYLAATRRPHAREQLARLLWPDHEAAAARTLLRTTLSQLRRHLAAAGGVGMEAITLLHTERDAVGREVVRIDRDGLPALRMDAELLEVDDAGEAADAEELLQAAAAAYRGPFLEGVAFDDAPELEEWVSSQRVRWQELVEGILERLSTLQLGRRAFTEATATARRWLGLNRLSEPAYQAVMRSLASAGDRAGALAVYEECRAVLQAELAVDPALETVALADRLRQLPRSSGPRAGPSEDTVPAPGEGAWPVPQQEELPFMGREQEFAALVAAYEAARQGQLQVVVIEGEAGIGKTRLVEEFLRWAMLDGADVLRGRGDEARARLPYQLLVDALRPRLDRENAPEDLVAEVWLTELVRLFPELHERYPDLPAPATLSGDEATGQGRLFEAVHQLILALAERARPEAQVLCYDDVQWADLATRDLLLYRLPRQREAHSPHLLLLTVRSEALATTPELEGWLATVTRQVPTTRLELGPLAGTETEQAIAAGFCFPHAQPTPLLGRTVELDAIEQRLIRDQVRLLSLVGPAGVGKTRLALEVGSRLADRFLHGINFVNLAPVREPTLVLPAMAQALGLTDSGPGPLLDRLREHLRDRTTLLILDNFEQVLPAGAALAELLASTPGLRILVTSRVPLRLRWEQTLRISPFAVPDPDTVLPLDELLQFPSVALFVERAQAQRADFIPTQAHGPILAQLTRQLDGLPLAIELAAAQMSVLPLAVIADRLEHHVQMLRWDAQDLPDRHRSLQATIDWGYELLPASEQQLFRHLGVFVGRVSLDAIEAVVGDGDVDRTLAGMVSLAEKSLVLPGQPDEAELEPAFGMLETVREYAREQLSRHDELEAASGAHARYFLALAEQADPQLERSGQLTWFIRLQSEHHNLRAALRWLLDQEEYELALRLATSLGYFWLVRRYHAEGGRWLQEALQNVPDADPRLRTTALLRGALLLTFKGEYQRSKVLLEEARALAQQHQDSQGIADSLAYLSMRAAFVGDWTESMQLLHDAMGYWGKQADHHEIGFALRHLGVVAFMQGKYQEAASLYTNVVQRLTAIGDERTAGLALLYLALSVWELGDVPRAIEILRDGIRMSLTFQDQRLLSLGVDAVLQITGDTAEPESGARLAGARDALNQATGVAQSMWEQWSDQSDARLRGQLELEGLGTAYRQGRSLPFQQIVSLALDVLQEFSQTFDGSKTAATGQAPRAG